MAHAYILSFTEPLNEVAKKLASLKSEMGSFMEFSQRVLNWKEKLCDPKQHIHLAFLNQTTHEDLPYLGFSNYQGNQAELAAFATFAFT